MDEQAAQNLEATLKDYERRIKEAPPAEQKRLIAEAMQLVTDAGITVPVEQLETTARFATHVVDTVLEGIIQTADQMGSDMVPVQFIRDLRPHMPDYITNSLLKAAQDIGVPIGFAGGVPDDLSGLEL